MISKTVVVNLPADAEARPVAVLVQIAGQVADLQPTGFKFAERPLEQRRVVRFEMDLAVFRQNVLVFLQKAAVRQAALGIFLARPRVAEVQKQPVDLAVGKIFLQLRRVERQEYQILQPHLQRFLHAEQHGLLHALDGDEQHIGVLPRSLDGELALSAADLQPERLGRRHQAAPIAAQRLAVAHVDRRAGLQTRFQIVSLSHSHGRFLQICNNE